MAYWISSDRQYTMDIGSDVHEGILEAAAECSAPIELRHTLSGYVDDNPAWPVLRDATVRALRSCGPQDLALTLKVCRMLAVPSMSTYRRDLCDAARRAGVSPELLAAALAR